MKKITISVCFIVKNEEKVFEKILKCAQKFADEIVVVDTGSTDKTIEIARKYTDKIYNFKWCDDFSKARNFAFSKGTCDYLMWLDADDFIFEKDIKKIVDLKVSGKTFDMAFFKYVTGYDENFKPTFEFERERLLRREVGYQWVEPVHEVIVPSGKVIHEDIKIYHFKGEKEKADRNLKIYEKRIAEGELLSPRAMFYYARELYYNAFYLKAIAEFNEFLKRKDAWIENKIEAQNLLSYLKTRFVRFLIAQVAVSQHITRSCFAFVPIQDFSKPWTDAELYAKYGLDEEEIAFIESMIKPMD